MGQWQKITVLAVSRQLAAVNWTLIVLVTLALLSSCKSSGRSDAPSIFSSDETAEAAKIVASANEDLTKIKVLYKDNEGKREDIK
jgi:hypothetical protein